METWPDANGVRGLGWSDANKTHPPAWWSRSSWDLLHPSADYSAFSVVSRSAVAVRASFECHIKVKSNNKTAFGSRTKSKTLTKSDCKVAEAWPTLTQGLSLCNTIAARAWPDPTSPRPHLLERTATTLMISPLCFWVHQPPPLCRLLHRKPSLMLLSTPSPPPVAADDLSDRIGVSSENGTSTRPRQAPEEDPVQSNPVANIFLATWTGGSCQTHGVGWTWDELELLCAVFVEATLNSELGTDRRMETSKSDYCGRFFFLLPESREQVELYRARSTMAIDKEFKKHILTMVYSLNRELLQLAPWAVCGICVG